MNLKVISSHTLYVWGAYAFGCVEAAASVPSSASAQTLAQRITLRHLLGSRPNLAGLYLAPMRIAERNLVMIRQKLPEGGALKGAKKP